MAKSKKQNPFGLEETPINGAQPLRVENDEDCEATISNLYINFRWPDSRRKKSFKIDGKELYFWSKEPYSRIVLMGKLSFELVTKGERKIVQISPRNQEDEFQFTVEVGLWTLHEALFYFFN